MVFELIKNNEENNTTLNSFIQMKDYQHMLNWCNLIGSYLYWAPKASPSIKGFVNFSFRVHNNPASEEIVSLFKNGKEWNSAEFMLKFTWLVSGKVGVACVVQNLPDNTTLGG